MRRGQPDAVMSDVVRRRIEELIAAGPRRVTDEAPAPPASQDTPGGTEGVPARPRAAPSFGRPHLAVVLILALFGCAYAAYGALSARTLPVASAAPAISVAPPPATPTAPPPIQVHVVGAVRKPGVVRLREGSRVQDAIAAAGGLRPDARPGALNLAAVVADASQIVVGSATRPGGEVRSSTPGSEGGGPRAVSGSDGRLDLNAATLAQLDTLPGVGPVTAQAIVAWRAEHRRFSRVEELQEVDGIGPKTFAQLAARIRV